MVVLKQQRSEGHRLGRCPVDALTSLHAEKTCTSDDHHMAG
jgi:hypothetical protein